MKIISSHLTGNANVKAAIEGFNKANMLSAFYVSLATFPGNLLHKIGGVSMFSEIRRRNFNPNLQPFVKMWPWLEIGRMVAPKIGMNRWTQKENAPFYIDTVCRNLDKRVASQLKKGMKNGASAMYGYEDTVLQSFEEAKRLGLQCLYDLPIGYWRAAHRLLEAEKQRWPAWLPTINAFGDSEEKNQRKDEELKLANHIFVASTFTKSTLKDFPGTLAPIHVIPYGFPQVEASQRTYANKERNQKVQLLFVGSLSQRKGIADLFAAVEGLENHVALTIVGRKGTNECEALNQSLVKHKWHPSLPHNEVLELMRQSDVLVFPSLFEGFGLVITEAMSQGTPVITTDRTAGPDLIQPDENGWLINAGNTSLLRLKIEDILCKPNSIKQVGQAAMESARKRPWEVYGSELSAAINAL